MQINASLPGLSPYPAPRPVATPAAEPRPQPARPLAGGEEADTQAQRQAERLIEAARAQAWHIPPPRQLSQQRVEPVQPGSEVSVEGELLTADQPLRARLRQPPALQAFMQVQGFAAAELLELGGRLDVYV